jgi:hypothetical protein
MRGEFEQLRSQRGRVSVFQLLGWRGLLTLAVGAALLVATLVAAASVFIVLLPVFLIAGLVARFVYGWRRHRRPAPTPSDPGIIEGRYEVVAEGRARDAASARSDPYQPSRRGWGPP